MKRLLGKLFPAEMLLLAMAVLAGCAAPSPRDFGGHWSQVNRFSTTPKAIPLQRPYKYFASPLDGTLKSMLSRWAKDTKMRLDYRFPDDFTLCKPVAAIQTPDVQTAVSELNSIYAKEGIFIAVRDGALVVTGATGSPTVAEPAPGGAAIAPAHAQSDQPHAQADDSATSSKPART